MDEAEPDYDGGQGYLVYASFPITAVRDTPQLRAAITAVRDTPQLRAAIDAVRADLQGGDEVSAEGEEFGDADAVAGGQDVESGGNQE